ncbi:hypothetical protein E3T54_02990 [Cryobacterium sp. Sr8]|uniref:hypothetical protein n=1 Tax=Cryobacterium sp. Sr8 TaxID=1259203 RepID=UPI001069EE45|nr:hypothetical protein [Cryobacterium sp. Sr8]TFD80723.1 hypothetical protein E3T54_02990 [Cryobacterium sp. Sr8]
MNMFSPYAKAIVGGIVSGLGTAAVALEDGAVSPIETIFIVLAFIAGTGFVYATPNKPAA